MQDTGFSCRRAQAICAQASVVVAQALIRYSLPALECAGFSSCDLPALEHRLSTCGSWATACRIFCGPEKKIFAMFPAMAGGFLSTMPSGESWLSLYKNSSVYIPVPKSQSVPPSHPSFLVTISSLSLCICFCL